MATPLWTSAAPATPPATPSGAPPLFPSIKIGGGDFSVANSTPAIIKPPASPAPFDATPLGYATNFGRSLFSEGLNLPKNIERGATAIKDFGQAVARTSESIFQSAFGLIDPNSFPETVAVPKLLQPIFGTDKIDNAGKQVLALENSIKTSPVAQKLGLDKHATMLGFAGVLGDELLNTVGLGFGEEETLIKKVSASKDAQEVSGFLKQRGIDPEVADKFAPHLVDLTNHNDIKGALDTMKGVQGLKETHTLTAPQEGLNAPSVEEDWAANYEQRYAATNDEITKLQGNLKVAPAADRPALSAELDKLVEENAKLEQEFLKAHGGEPMQGEVPPAGAEDVSAPQTPAAPDLTYMPVGEEESLVQSAKQHEEWQYETKGNPEDTTTADLEKTFADLRGISTKDLKIKLTDEDLANAKTEYEIAQETLLDHPGRALMKYVSRETGDLPEVRGARVLDGSTARRGKFNKEGDTIIQNLLGQEVSKGGDVVVAQEWVDDYKNLKARVTEIGKRFRETRAAIKLKKEAGTFVENAKRLIARETVKDIEALRNLIASAKRAEAGSWKGRVHYMAEELKARRGKLISIQNRFSLTDSQMRRIMGRTDPRFMTGQEFASFRDTLEERAAGLRTSLSRYGTAATPGQALINAVPKAEEGSWQSMVKGYFRTLKPEARADALDYLATPEFVLERLGLNKAGEMLHDAQDAYLSTRDAELAHIADWKAQAGTRPYAATRIFRYLDGREKEVHGEMSPEELAVAREIRGYLKGWADRLHLPEDNRIARYITHLFEPGGEIPEIDMFDDPELSAIMQDRAAGTVYDPFLQQRLGKRGYVEDVWRALDAYVKRASRKEAFDPVLDQIRLQSKGLDQRTYDYLAALTHRINMRPTKIDGLIDDFVTHRLGVTRFTPRPVAYISRVLRTGYYRGLLGLNVSSALRNLSQGANTYAKLGEKYTIIGYAKVLSRLATRDLSDLYQTHVLDEAMVQDRKVGLFKTTLQKLDPVLFSMFDTAEKINRGAAFYGAKAQALKKGLSEEEAIKYGKRIVRETQFAFSAVDTPVVLASDLVKTLTQLQTYNVKQIEFLSRMVRNKEYAGILRYSLASLGFVYTVGQLFGMTPQQLIPTIRFGGSPIVSSLSNIYNSLAGNAQDKASAQKNLLKTTIYNRIPGGAQLLGKTVPGVRAYNAGKDVTPTGKTRFEIPKTPGNLAKVLLFGKSSLPQAQKYYDGIGKKKSSSSAAGLW